MRIEGVDDQVQQLIDFGLKFTFRHRSLLSTKTCAKTSPSTAVGRESLRSPWCKSGFERARLQSCRKVRTINAASAAKIRPPAFDFCHGLFRRAILPRPADAPTRCKTMLPLRAMEVATRCFHRARLSTVILKSRSLLRTVLLIPPRRRAHATMDTDSRTAGGCASRVALAIDASHACRAAAAHAIHRAPTTGRRHGRQRHPEPEFSTIRSTSALLRKSAAEVTRPVRRSLIMWRLVTNTNINVSIPACDTLSAPSSLRPNSPASGFFTPCSCLTAPATQTPSPKAWSL